jgi:hypothetical protein
MGKKTINFEIASERATLKEYMLLPPNDGQWKHPEHLNEHELLQVLQRESLNENWPVVKEMLLAFPEGKRKDLTEMLRRSNRFFLIDKDFPDKL